MLLLLLPVFVLLSWIRSFRHAALLNVLGNLSYVRPPACRSDGWLAGL